MRVLGLVSRCGGWPGVGVGVDVGLCHDVAHTSAKLETKAQPKAFSGYSLHAIPSAVASHSQQTFHSSQFAVGSSLWLAFFFTLYALHF